MQRREQEIRFHFDSGPFFDIINADWKRGRSYVKEPECSGKICSSMEKQCRRRGYAASVDVLMDIGALSIEVVIPADKYLI